MQGQRDRWSVAVYDRYTRQELEGLRTFHPSFREAKDAHVAQLTERVRRNGERVLVTCEPPLP